jgi:putative endonuclease
MKWNWLKRWKTTESSPDHLTSGLWGEQQAERMLREKGYKVLGRRVRVGRRDELDLVARKDELLVFFEVKTRRDESFGRPASAVDRRKRAALSRAAVRYLARVKQRPPYYRFDVVEVIGDPDSGLRAIRHIESAFQLGPRYRAP